MFLQANFVFLFLTFIHLFIGRPGSLLPQAGFLSRCGEGGYSLIAVHGLLSVVAPRCETQLWGAPEAAARGLSGCGSKARWSGHGLRCLTACGVFPQQGSNLCPLRWQVDCSLDHQGSPTSEFHNLIMTLPNPNFTLSVCSLEGPSSCIHKGGFLPHGIGLFSPMKP